MWRRYVEEMVCHVGKGGVLCVKEICGRDGVTCTYGVATVSRIDQIIGLFCKRAL